MTPKMPKKLKTVPVPIFSCLSHKNNDKIVAAFEDKETTVGDHSHDDQQNNIRASGTGAKIKTKSKEHPF